MPILAREPDVYPEDLLWRDGSCLSDAGQWWVLYTRSRREKDLMRRLRAMSVSFYGPLIAKQNRSPGGRVRTSYLPLFPNYVFLYGDQASRLRALTTNCVSRCIDVPDCRQLADELRRIHHLIRSGLPVHREAELEPGRRVRLRTGPLRGHEGILIKRHGKRHLLVAISFIQQGASVLLDDYDVELID